MNRIHVGILSALLCLSSITMVAAASNDKPVVTDPFAGNTVNVDEYYITKGSAFDKVTGLLASLPASVTGINRDYYFRMDKGLTGNYFYHVRAYDANTRVMLGEYFVAKDDSCAWRLDTGKEAELIYGNTDKLMEKVEVVIYPSKIPIDGYGIVRVHVPGMLPYDLKATSLNETVATISNKMNIEPKDLGTTDIVVEVKLGSNVKSFTQPISVVSKQTATSRRDGDSGSGRTNIGIGIGIGWGGGGWHHHGGHHGGVDIGIGVGWNDGNYWDV